MPSSDRTYLHDFAWQEHEWHLHYLIYRWNYLRDGKPSNPIYGSIRPLVVLDMGFDRSNRRPYGARAWKYAPPPLNPLGILKSSSALNSL